MREHGTYTVGLDKLNLGVFQDFLQDGVVDISGNGVDEAAGEYMDDVDAVQPSTWLTRGAARLVAACAHAEEPVGKSLRTRHSGVVVRVDATPDGELLWPKLDEHAIRPVAAAIVQRLSGRRRERSMEKKREHCRMVGKECSEYLYFSL